MFASSAKLVLERAIANDPTLTHLKWPMFVINNDDARTLANALSNNIFVKRLDFWNTFVPIRHVNLLMHALALNNTLTTLHLNHAVHDDKHAVAWANAFGRACTLNHVSLAQNHISSVGASALAQAIAHNQSLIRLDLS